MSESARLEHVLDKAQELDSGQCLEDVDAHFRVFAGPGAGKTHWLVEHIKNVIASSDRLGPGQRIACISYTSVAAEEVHRRLGSAAAHVDVSTIHSFLYRNVVKPYLPWVKDDEGKPLVAYEKVDGHNKHRPTRGTVHQWIKEVSNVGGGLWAFDNTEAVFRYLRKLEWQWDGEEEEWEIKRGSYPPDEYFPRSDENLKAYKARCWQAGLLDHGDVLYFALRILREHRQLLPFLSARYPYLFVDEFQDMTRSQTEIVRMLAGEETATGVIGDVEQSIFEFAGARPEELLAFEPDGQSTYYIPTNRRTTASILPLLNRIRRGRKQQLHKEESSSGDDETEAAPSPPTLLVGPLETAWEYVRDQFDAEAVALTRRKKPMRILASAGLTRDADSEVWEDLFEVEAHRPGWLAAVLEATHEAQAERYGQAVSILYRGLRTKNGKLTKYVFTESRDRTITRDDKRRVAASLLPFLLLSHRQQQGKTGLEFYRALREAMKEIRPDTPMKNVTANSKLGGILGGVTYDTLYATTVLDSGSGNVKTIHKSKGEEHPTVMVYRGGRDEDSPDAMLDHLLGRESEEEERRVTYVALSRAEEHLFLCVEDAPRDDKQMLQQIDVEVKDIGGYSARN